MSPEAKWDTLNPVVFEWEACQKNIERSLQIIEKPQDKEMCYPLGYKKGLGVEERAPEGEKILKPEETPKVTCQPCPPYLLYPLLSYFSKPRLGFSFQWNLLDDANHIDVLLLLAPSDWE